MKRFRELTERVETLEANNKSIRARVDNALLRLEDLEGAFRAIARMHIKDYVEEMDAYCVSHVRYRHYLIDLKEDKPKKKAIKHKPKVPDWKK
jgi:hypothetical protein